MAKEWLILILLAVAGSFEWFAVGLPEKDAKYRALSLLATVPIAVAAALAFMVFYELLPFWLALPAGIGALGAAFVAIYFIVGKIVPSKTRPREDV